jgi:hypothetical protein
MSADEIQDADWQLFDEAPDENETESMQYVEYLSNNTNLSTAITNFEFIHMDLDRYILPSKSYLQITGVVGTTANPSVAYANTVNVALTNNALNIFERADYLIDGTPLESVREVGVSTTIHNLLNFSQDYIKSNGSNVGWAPDTNTGVVDREPIAAKVEHLVDGTWAVGAKGIFHENPTYNEGFKKRQSYSIKGGLNLTTFYIPLSSLFGFCDDFTKPTRGVRHTLRLVRNTFANMFHVGAGGETPQFDIKKLSWWMPIVTPSITVDNKIMAKLNSGNKIPINFLSKDTFRSDSTTNKSRTWRVTTQSQKPTRIFVALQRSAKLNTLTQNNMIFDNMDLESIYINVNSQQYPVRAYELNYSDVGSEDYSRAYMDLMAYKGFDTSDGVQISHTDFKALYSIYHFDLTNMADDIYTRKGSADISITYKIRGNGAADSHHVYCMIQSMRSANLEGNSTTLRLTQL